MAVKDFFIESQKQEISKSIERAELNTSGEIRVHLEDTCKTEPLKRAIEVFEKLAMHQTEQRNGVLFYLAVKDKKFAVMMALIYMRQSKKSLIVELFDY